MQKQTLRYFKVFANISGARPQRKGAAFNILQHFEKARVARVKHAQCAEHGCFVLIDRKRLVKKGNKISNGSGVALR